MCSYLSSSVFITEKSTYAILLDESCDERKIRNVGQTFRDKQAIAELSTEPLSNHTLTVTATRAVICLIL